MLAHLAQASRRPARSWLAAAPRRHASSADGGPEDPFKQGPSYALWLRTEGIKFRESHRANNWLGGEVPFPLNPSFKPPTPIGWNTRTAIWHAYITDPGPTKVRSLAQRFGLSIARVDAILRLQGLETRWEEGKPVQIGFMRNMEEILGVDQKGGYGGTSAVGFEELSDDANQADELSEATKNVARARYQRLFFEPAVDGKDPILPTVLAQASVRGVTSAKAREDALMKGLHHLKFETEPEVVVERPGRPTLRFVDVGVKFVDVKDQLKRVNAAKRRKILSRKRMARHVASEPIA